MKHLLSATFALLFYNAQSQSITPEVISSSGGDGSSAGAQVSWTVGEPIITTETGSTAIVTQGFLQPDDLSNSIEELFDESGISIYPNPVIDNLNILLPETFLHSHISLFDSKGALIKRIQSDKLDHQIDLTALSKGIYIIHVSNNDKAYGFKLDKQ